MEESAIKVKNAFQESLDLLSPLYDAQEAKSMTELLFCDLLACSRFELYRNFAANLPNSLQNKLSEYLKELQSFKPLQYVLGETEFYGLKFRVGPGVLIPRPETEELVHWIIHEYKEKRGLKILDIGTGSGCIAVSLAFNMKEAEVDALDMSVEALNYARLNAELNNCKLNLLEKDIFTEELDWNSAYDIIVSNPPYIPRKEKGLLLANVVNFEPDLALFVPDEDPLIYYRRIMEISLIKGKKGAGNFEIHENYAVPLKELFLSMGFIDVSVKMDINGKYRMASGKVPG